MRAGGIVDENTERILVGCGVVAALVTALLLGRAAVTSGYDVNPAKIRDAAMFLVLGAGLLWRSRVCAALVLIDYAYLRVDVFVRTGDLPAAFGVLAIVSVVCFALALIANVAHHQRARTMA